MPTREILLARSRKQIRSRRPGRRNAVPTGMRFIRWLIVLAPALLIGQTVSLDLSPPIRESGRTIALVQLFSRAGGEPAALQWTLRGQPAKSVQIEAGEQAIAAKKQITCAHSKDQITCVIWGANRNLIHNGLVAKVIVPGTGFHLRLGHISAASADGGSLAIEASSGSGEAPDAKPLLPGFSAILAGAALLGILLAIYLVRRLSSGRPISKRRQASGRSGPLR